MLLNKNFYKNQQIADPAHEDSENQTQFFGNCDKGLGHWDDREGWDAEGGARGVQDVEHM